MYDKKLVSYVFDKYLLNREDLYSKLNDINSFNREDDDDFTAMTARIENLRDDLCSDNYIPKDDYVRLAADFYNFKKRTARDKADVINQANKDVILDLLGIVDDMERLLTASDGTGPLDSGFKMIYDNLIKLLDAEGCSKIDVKTGDRFNPDFHEAMLRQESSDGLSADSIANVLQSGWMLNGRLLRAAKVAVVE